jgi:transcriptional regulator with XRE-family HTH domain
MYRPEPQPAKAVIVMRRLQQKRLARQLDVSQHYLGRVLNGYEPGSSRIRTGLSAILGLPEEALFRQVERDEVAT